MTEVHVRARLRTRARPVPAVYGFSMVEMLVALVVLGVGMLGVASLFATSMRSSSGAISRMQAVNLANDLADKIRANPTAGSAYQAAAANKDCVGGAVGAKSCSAANLAASDLYIWNQQIAATWPGNGASGTVTVDTTTTVYTYTIQITWTDPGDGQQTYTLRTQI